MNELRKWEEELKVEAGDKLLLKECIKKYDENRMKEWDKWFNDEEDRKERREISKVLRDEKVKNINKKINEKNKLKVLIYYGGNPPKCVCCGEKTPVFLTINHINQDGAKHRKEIGKGNLNRWIIKNHFPNKFEVLCWNCNWGKHINKGVCPHKIIYKNIK